MSIHFIGVEELEAKNPGLELIEDFGPYQVYFNPTDRQYYAKGPFARWDAICYISLHPLNTREKVNGWINEMKKANHL